MCCPTLSKQTEDSKVLNFAVAKLPRVDLFCTHEPRLVGEEVFGSQKRKANVLLGFEGESHHPDKVNFSRPRVATKSAIANHANCSLSNMVEELSPDLQKKQALINLGTTTEIRKPLHVTAILKTTCKEIEWHTARLPKTSVKAYFA